MRLIVLPALVGLVVLLVVALNINRHVSVGDVRWIAGTADVSAAQADVYRRYLTRHRQHRLVGGLLGTVLGILLGLRWSATIPLALVLFCGVAGVLVGSLSAETYRLSRPRASDGTGPSLRTASLAPRPPLAHGRVVTSARSILAGALVLGAGAVLSGTTTPLLVALAGVAVAGVAEWTRATVRSRQRPALSPEAAVVDHQIRTFAARSITWLEAGVATLTLGQTIGSIPLEAEPLVAAQTLTTLVLLAASFVLVHRASPQRPWSAILRPSRQLPVGAGVGDAP